MVRHSHQIFDNKGPARRLVEWVSGRTGAPEGVKASVKESGSTGGPEDGRTGVETSGSKGGNWSGFTAGETTGPGLVVQGGNLPGNGAVVQPGSMTVVHAAPDSMVQGGEPSGVLFGVELHVVDGRLIACRPGELPPLSVREHTKAFLEWLRNHEKVPGVEVPVAVLEGLLYWDFLRDTGLPMKSWRTVSDILAKLPGVKKYQADWRDPAGEGSTPVVFKVSKRRRRRAAVVDLTAAERKRA